LLYFEKTMLLETLDPTWKDHLYMMDQLRDSIGFRAFSQQDPRIEYKREGSKLFGQMMESVREKVTDLIFKLELKPQVGPASPPPGAGPSGIRPAGGAGGGGGGGGPANIAPGGSSRDLYGSAAPVARPAVGTGVVPAGITGPGLDGPLNGPGSSTPSPMSERQQRDLDAAQRAGSAGEKAATINKSAEKRYGRNDTCPQGSGRKYKKCCNRPDGTCTGQGLSNPSSGPDGEE
jgi:preprotein translocase subunit SecA